MINLYNVGDTDGLLEKWIQVQVTKKEFIIYGDIYNDKKGRWEDGSRIHTSGILNQRVRPGDIVQTRNSRYTLGEKG